MKKIATITFSIICMSLVAAKPSFAMPIQWLGNGNYYDLVSGFYYWTDANKAASESTYLGFSGHLATLTSSAEETWLKTTFGNLDGYLLGGTDMETEGVWTWVTGETWDYTAWRSEEPNDGAYGNVTEDYLQFHPAGGGWNDIGDYNSPGNVSGYIVEYESRNGSNAVPEPATMLLFGVGLTGMAFRKSDRRES